MNIQILQYLEGAKKAEGLTVVIDVFRAFTVGCYVMNNGASEIIAAGSVETAKQLRYANPDSIVIGERNERKVEGFDFGNSPTHIESYDFTGKTVVQTTSAGTQGLVQAKGADEIITGSLVNADAVITYIRQKDPSVLSLVAMGYAGKLPTEEDLLCAEYIRDVVQNQKTNLEDKILKLKEGSGSRFFDPANVNHSPPDDFFLCTRIGIFDFILKANEIYDDYVILKKQEINLL